MRAVFGVLLVVLSLAGCGNDDIGQPCAVDSCGVGAPPDNANTVCEPALDCATLVCVGQGQGLGTGNVDQYCTIDCDINDDKSCPEGFECAIVANVGGNANRTMCLKPL